MPNLARIDGTTGIHNMEKEPSGNLPEQKISIIFYIAGLPLMPVFGISLCIRVYIVVCVHI